MNQIPEQGNGRSLAIGRQIEFWIASPSRLNYPIPPIGRALSLQDLEEIPRDPVFAAG